MDSTLKVSTRQNPLTTNAYCSKSCDKLGLERLPNLLTWKYRCYYYLPATNGTPVEPWPAIARKVTRSDISEKA